MSSRIRLTDEEIAAVVERAHEISDLEGRLSNDKNELDQYVDIAEEMGVPRDAMQQALNERFAFLDEQLDVGQVVFAKSGDGHYYPATIQSSDESSVGVSYFNGGEGNISRKELQSMSFSPGTKYHYYSPMNMSYVKGRVVRYDKQALTVTFNTWGVEETVPLAKVQMRSESNYSPTVLNAWMIATGAFLIGGTFATFITWLVMR